MILGLGIDLTDIVRIEKVYKRYGLKFAQRFLTPKELEYLPEQPISWLAGRFAAKEASAKALGTGFQKGILWQDILIIPNEWGRPELFFEAYAKEFALALGVKRCHLSISHERHMACAAVILED